MFGLTGDVVAGFIRHVFTTFGGFLASKGFLTGDEWEVVGGGLATIVGVVWSAVSKKKAEPVA